MLNALDSDSVNDPVDFEKAVTSNH